MKRPSPSAPTLALVLGLFFAAPFLAARSAEAQYQIVGTTSTQLPGNVVRTEITVQAGANPLDSFKVIRVARDVAPRHLRSVVFLLPPLGVEFTNYEQQDPHRGLGSSIAGFFALRNFDVWGFSSRLEGVPGGTCEAGVLDCSTMAGWNIQTQVEDITFARAQIEAARPGVPVFVGGLSLGGMTALAVVDAHPQDYTGVFAWEGALFTPDPQVRAINQAACATAEAQLAAGILYDGVGGSVLKKVAKLAETQPSGLTAIPLFPPFLTNHQVLVATFAEANPGPVSMPTPNYRFLAGSLAEDRFLFASEERLTENISRFNDYIPTALVRDVTCSLAGVETAYVDNLGSFEGPALGIGGGLGFGPYLADHLGLLGSDDVQILFEPAFGHVDHLFHPRRPEYVERPLLRWLLRHGR